MRLCKNPGGRNGWGAKNFKIWGFKLCWANDALPGTRKGKKESSRKRNVQEGVCKGVANGFVGCEDTRYEIRDMEEWVGSSDEVRLRRSSGPGRVIGGDDLSLIIEEWW